MVVVFQKKFGFVALSALVLVMALGGASLAQYVPPADCAEAWAQGYGLSSDIDQDCSVGLADFSEIAKNWGLCDDPANGACPAVVLSPAVDPNDSSYWEGRWECDDNAWEAPWRDYDISGDKNPLDPCYTWLASSTLSGGFTNNINDSWVRLDDGPTGDSDGKLVSIQVVPAGYAGWQGFQSTSSISPNSKADDGKWFAAEYGVRVPNGNDIGVLIFKANIGSLETGTSSIKLTSWSTWNPAPAGWTWTGTGRHDAHSPAVEWDTITPVHGWDIHTLRMVHQDRDAAYYVDDILVAREGNVLLPAAGDITLQAYGSAPPPGPGRWDVDYVSWTTHFDEPGPKDCNDVWALGFTAHGYGLAGDLNKDCYVGLPDLALLSNAWLDCIGPEVSPGCPTPEPPPTGGYVANSAAWEGSWECDDDPCDPGLPWYDGSGPPYYASTNVLTDGFKFDNLGAWLRLDDGISGDGKLVSVQKRGDYAGWSGFTSTHQISPNVADTNDGFAVEYGIRIPDAADIHALSINASVGAAKAGFEVWEWNEWKAAPAGEVYLGTAHHSLQGPGGDAPTLYVEDNQVHAFQIVFYGTSVEYYIDGYLFQRHPIGVIAQEGWIKIETHGSPGDIDVGQWDVDYIRWTNDIDGF